MQDLIAAEKARVSSHSLFPSLPVFVLLLAAHPCPYPALVKVFVRSSTSQCVTCSVKSSFLNRLTGTRSGSGDGADYTNRSKGRREIEKEAEGRSPLPRAAPSCYIYLTAYEKAAKLKCLSISKALRNDAPLLALQTCELEDMHVITLVLLSSLTCLTLSVHPHRHILAHFLRTKSLIKGWEYTSAASRLLLPVHSSYLHLFTSAVEWAAPKIQQIIWNQGDPRNL